MRIALFLGALVSIAACAHSDSGLTAAEHRNEAALLAARAQEHTEQAMPPNARPMSVRPLPSGAMPAGDQTMLTYTPTDATLAQADEDLRAAARHLAAARELESFEARACEGLPVAQRSACPLLASSVTMIKNVDLGFQMVMKPGIDVDKTNRMLRCHLAYAEKTGFDRPSCPLFVRGTSIRQVGDTIIEFSGDSREVASQLQVQAQRVFQRASAPLPQP